MIAAFSLLMSGGALAQTTNGSVPDARVRTANAEWRRLSQNEVNCVDKSLRAKSSGVWFLIQRGISPSDAAVATVRAACRTQARALNPTTQTVAGAGAGAMAAADRAALDKAAADKVAADKVAADKAATEKAAADKAVADRAAAAKAAADKAAADKAVADKSAADKAASDRAAADRAAAIKAGADNVVASTAAAENAAPDRTVLDKPVPDKAELELARAEAERATAEALKAQAETDRARKESEKAMAEFGLALAAAESKVSFVYGLTGGLVLVGLGGFGFVFIRRKMHRRVALSQAVSPENDNRGTQGEFDRLVASVLDEQRRRARKTPTPTPKASVTERRAEKPAPV